MVKRTLAVTGFLLLIWSSCLIAAEYQFKTVAAPGARHTVLFGINDLGDAVGYSADCDFCQPEPVLYSDGQFYDVGVEGALRLTLLGINRDGLIVGGITINGDQFGFIQDDKQTTILEHAVRADGINNRGVVVGYESRGSPQLAYVYRRGKYLSFLTTAQIPGILGSAATGIASNGAIVGYYFYQKPDFSFVTQGFIRKDGLVAPVDLLPLGVNRDGLIVGLAGIGYDGAVLENGIIQLIKVPGADYTQVHGINNRGHLVGYYQKAGQVFGFIAKPVSLNK